MLSIKELSYKKFKKYYKKNLEFKKQLNLILLTSFPIVIPLNLTLNTLVQLDIFSCVKLMLIKDKDNYPESKNPLTYFTESIWYIEKESKVIGFGILRFLTNVPLLYIHTVCILKEERRKGYCKGLLKQIIKKCQNLTFVVDVRTEKKNPNIPAINCYKKLGFNFTSISYIRPDGENKMMVYNLSKSLSELDVHQIIHEEEPTKWALSK